MSRVRLAFTDFPGPFNHERILLLLRTRFDVEIVDQEPDYVIFSVAGTRFLSHPDAIRIFFTGENLRPDFNLCDYAFGYDWLDFGDRHYRWPNYQLYDHFKELCQRRRSEEKAASKKEFCNFIYSNPDADPYRDTLFHALNRYRAVHSAGRHLNNIGFTPGSTCDWCRAKVEFQRAYKFSIACENSSTPGYTTEKIVHALAADTIPIYFGNPLIAREFNPKRFVNCHDLGSIEAVVAEVAEIDRDEARFRQMLSETFFVADRVPAELTDGAILDRFAHIFGQPKASAFRRNRYFWGAKYEALRQPRDPFAELLTRVSDQLVAILPEGTRYILADEGQWAAALKIAGRENTPFTEQNGEYWGPPEDDRAAIAELHRQRDAGARFLVFGAPAFWYFDHYAGFSRYVVERFSCLLRNERIIVFDLTATAPAGQTVKPAGLAKPHASIR
jgi:hypothetical protein